MTKQSEKEKKSKKSKKEEKNKGKKKKSSKIKDEFDSWEPKTELGRMVKGEKVTSIEEALSTGKRIQEPEIIDILLPDMEEVILKIGSAGRPFRWVQRMTDSGRRNRYYVMVALGNRRGHLGLGSGVAKEYGGAIEAAVRDAKLNVMEVSPGCGSWDCACGGSHSVPIETKGKAGSVSITLRPAPRGTGLVVNEISREILELAGLSDIWSLTKGHTATRSNLAKATFNALYNLNKVKGHE